jgi:3-dehydroquinate synthase
MTILSLPTYDIHIGAIQNALSAFSFEKYSQILILCDENTEKNCVSHFLHLLNHPKINVIRIQSGEQHKNLAACEKIWQQMIHFNADRKAIMLNVGGGVIGDMGGFCACTFKRGMDFIQIPTTLLSQVDASIGGKLGIDFQGIKNSIGVFNDPQAVWIDPIFVETLSARERISGFAEIIKHALIADKSQFESLQKIKDLSKGNLETIIPQSLMVKRDIVEKDPFEKNVRKALNFGHTIGHAVESYFLETSEPLLHGEAIAIGMICESFLSHKANLLEKEALEAISSFILKHYEKRSIPQEIYPTLLELMQQDKKNENNAINFTFLKNIGHFEINQYATSEKIEESIDFYNNLH